jgi:hypothetical protein
MPITNRNLEPGTRLIANFKKQIYHALVVAGPEGKVLYQLVPYDGKEFRSPSSLGTAVTGKSCNGWTFWSVETSAPEAKQPPAAEGETPTAQEPPMEEETGPEEQEPAGETPAEGPTG